MSLQKTWGNIHLTALGAMMLSFLLVGCDDSVAQNAAPPAPTVSAAKVLVKSISQWDSFNGRIEAVESVQLRPRVSAITFGLAPGYSARTWTLGGTTSGYSLTGSSGIAINPVIKIKIDSTAAKIGLSIKKREKSMCWIL